MPAQIFGSEDKGVAFLVSAGIVYEIIAAACSSPQTTEINADTRADTLMKWVHLGLAQAVLFVAAAAAIDKENRGAIILGGATAGALMYGQYSHAKRAGLASAEPPTERKLRTVGGY
jgi:uncharacterized membrane protein